MSACGYHTQDGALSWTWMSQVSCVWFLFSPLNHASQAALPSAGTGKRGACPGAHSGRGVGDSCLHS